MYVRVVLDRKQASFPALYKEMERSLPVSLSLPTAPSEYVYILKVYLFSVSSDSWKSIHSHSDLEILIIIDVFKLTSNSFLALKDIVFYVADCFERVCKEVHT